MDKVNKFFLDEKFRVFKQYWENKVRFVEIGLSNHMRSVAKSKIAEVRANMESSIHEVREQYEKEMATADKYAEMSELAGPVRESARRQLESNIQLLKEIADSAIRSIQNMV